MTVPKFYLTATSRARIAAEQRRIRRELAAKRLERNANAVIAVARRQPQEILP
jgi:hypothetical protein